jgi:two-component system, NarL family, response regulator NreC
VNYRCCTWLARAHSTKQIAALPGISVKTANSHRAKLMGKRDLDQVAGLVRYAIRSGLIEP